MIYYDISYLGVQSGPRIALYLNYIQIPLPADVPYLVDKTVCVPYYKCFWRQHNNTSPTGSVITNFWRKYTNNVIPKTPDRLTMTSKCMLLYTFIVMNAASTPYISCRAGIWSKDVSAIRLLWMKESPFNPIYHSFSEGLKRKNRSYSICIDFTHIRELNFDINIPADVIQKAQRWL